MSAQLVAPSLDRNDPLQGSLTFRDMLDFKRRDAVLRSLPKEIWPSSWQIRPGSGMWMLISSEPNLTVTENRPEPMQIHSPTWLGFCLRIDGAFSAAKIDMQEAANRLLASNTEHDVALAALGSFFFGSEAMQDLDSYVQSKLDHASNNWKRVTATELADSCVARVSVDRALRTCDQMRGIHPILKGLADTPEYLRRASMSRWFLNSDSK